MGRHFSFDDRRVGKGDGEFFKVTGTKDRPQRIAYIPCEVTDAQLAVSAELERRAKAGDPRATEEIEDIRALREELTKSLQRKPVPSAEVWTNDQGKRVVLYAKTEGARTFWIDGVGYVYYRDDIPADALDKQPQIVYGLVLLEYELDANNDPIMLRPDSQIDLGGGHKLTFRYDLKPWSINDAKIRAWKEHSRTNPVIWCDYLVWQQREGQYDRVKFSPAGPAIWRQDQGAMNRVIKEARKMIDNLPRLIAKDFSVEDIIQMLGGGKPGGRRQDDSHTKPMPEEIDFANLLGVGMGGSAPAERQALENRAPQSVMDFPSLEAGAGNGSESSYDDEHPLVG